MKKIICVIKDEKAGFLNPVAFDAEPIAVRHFKNLVADENGGLVHLNPEDFSYYNVGEYDTKTGFIVSYEPKLICRAVDFVRGEEL